MSVPQSRYSREEVARLGDDIYKRDVLPRIEPGDVGRYVAIDLETHAYVIADDLLSASNRLQEQHPNAEIWLVRVGHRGLHRIGGHSALKTQHKSSFPTIARQ